MRKILEERLENAKLDYRYHLTGLGSDGLVDTNIYKIEGQIEAYQDCLNLLPPVRTEAEILKDFELLGYVIVDNNKHDLILVKDMGLRLMINKELKHYMVVALTPLVNMQEHKLLNELFEVWKWC